MTEQLNEDVISKIREMKQIMDESPPPVVDETRVELSKDEIVPVSEVKKTLGTDEFNVFMDEAIKEGLQSCHIVSESINRSGNSIIKTITFMIKSNAGHTRTIDYYFEIRLDSYYGAMVEEERERIRKTGEEMLNYATFT